jgi:hypothetical protein
MNRRQFIVKMIYGISWAGVGIAAQDILINGSADRRFVLYNIRRELRKGMSRRHIEAIADRHYAPFVEQHERDDILAFTVWLSAMRNLTLLITFADQKLVRAEFVGIDSPEDTPRDAPRPIL